MVVVTAKHIVEGGLDASGRCNLAVSVFTTLQILYNTIITNIIQYNNSNRLQCGHKIYYRIVSSGIRRQDPVHPGRPCARKGALAQAVEPAWHSCLSFVSEDRSQ